MEFDDFVEAIQAAGWRAHLDAQHTEIRRLWEKLFPVIAKLSAELSDRDTEIDQITATAEKLRELLHDSYTA